MAVWAIADLHLSFGVPDKGMDIFGKQWEQWTVKIEDNWRARIHDDDLVLLAGDTSWAMRPEEARPDLEWIDELPGTKVIIRGNHDYWWTSASQVKKTLPASIHFIQNNAFHWQDITIGGARLWDTAEYNFNDYIDFIHNPRAKTLAEMEKPSSDMEKIYRRELGRLELSLKDLNPKATTRIAMVHYPPISADLKESEASAILERYHIDICVFGHLHNLKKDASLFGTKNDIQYILTSCDYLQFVPIKILD